MIVIQTEVYEYIHKEIWLCCHMENKWRWLFDTEKPIVQNQDNAWHQLIDEAGEIYNKVVQKFDLEGVTLIKTNMCIRNTDAGTDLYYYIEDKLLSCFDIVDESTAEYLEQD